MLILQWVKDHFYVLLNETGDKNVKIRTLYNKVKKLYLMLNLNI